jgi:hypothetical protein
MKWCERRLADWERLASDLPRAQKNCPVQFRTTFAEMFDAIEAHRSFWYVIEKDNEVVADMIVCVGMSGHDRVLYFQHLAGSGLADWNEDVQSDFEALARKLHCKAILAETYDDVVARLYRKTFPNDQRMYTFRRELGYGQQTTKQRHDNDHQHPGMAETSPTRDLESGHERDQRVEPAIARSPDSSRLAA